MMTNNTGVRIKQMKTAISRNGLILCCAVVTHIYIEDCKGDEVMCHAIVESYEHHVQDIKHKEEKKINKDGDISNDHLFCSLKIDPADDNFIAFQNIVDTKTMGAMKLIIGNFTPLTDPTYTQGMLSELTSAFVKYLPVAYKAIMTLFNQHSVEENKK
eukprot:5118372-Ditylum_brightwellii.AAC.1